MHPEHHEHGTGTGHSHSHAPSGSLKALLITLAMTATIFVAQVIGGLFSGSLALLSDAMHMLSDSTGLLIALLAILVGRRAATDRATYGHRRVEVIAAALNAVVVIGVSVWIVVSAIGRFSGEHEINTGLMVVVAAVGLLANAVSAAILMRHQNDSLNMKGAYLHVLSDLFGSIAVIIAGGIIQLTGWTAADAVASLLIAALVLPRALRLLTAAVSVLLNHAPSSIDTGEVSRALAQLPGVESVHDLHIWSTDGDEALATCHLVLAPELEAGCGVLDKAQARLRDFSIEHSTIQIEESAHSAHEKIC